MRIPFDDYDPRLIRIAAMCGLTPISADVRSGDPDPNISGGRIAQYVPQVVKPGSIVLMHANGNGVHTAEGLPALLKGLRKRGFRPVTVGEMLGIDADEASR